MMVNASSQNVHLYCSDGLATSKLLIVANLLLWPVTSRVVTTQSPLHIGTEEYQTQHCRFLQEKQRCHATVATAH